MGTVGGDEFNVVGRGEMLIQPVTVVGAVAISRVGSALTNRAASVASTSLTSCGEALATWMARGRPWRSLIAMILLPLPRRVGPMAEPFSRAEAGVDESLAEIEFPRSRRSSASHLSRCRSRPLRCTVESADDTSDTADIARADRARARRCAAPRGCRSIRREHPSGAGHAHRHGDDDETGARGSAIARESGPYRRVRRSRITCSTQDLLFLR